MSRHGSGGFKTQEELPALHTIFHGQVASVQKYGVFVALPGYNRHGLVHVSQMSSVRIEDPAEMLAKGEKVYCKVISVETEGSKIGLSMKLVNQTSGQDLDPNNVQLSQDEKRRKRFFAGERPPIELGAVYDTTCRNCGGHGHLAMECFVGKGGKQYDLLPELDAMVPSDSEPEAEPQHMSKDTSTQQKKKKEKKEKKEKKKMKRRHSSSSNSSEGDRNRKQEAKKKKKRLHSSSSDRSDREQHKKHRKSSHKHRS